MIPSYEAYACSSFLMFLDNRLCSSSGFYNVSTVAYPMSQTVAGFSVYTFPFSQVIGDRSISGATVFSGVYVNNSFITPGTSGFSGINFERGQLMFDKNYAPNIQTISGNYAIKEINVTLPNVSDATILFESKLSLRDYAGIKPTGIANNILTYPVVFVESSSAPSNTPWNLGGLDQTRSVFNLYFFGDSLYQKTNFISLCKDMAYKYVPLITDASEFPFNSLGYYKNGVPYNYSTLTAGRVAAGRGALIESVEIIEFGKRGLMAEVQSMTPDAFFILATVSCWTSRVTR